MDKAAILTAILRRNELRRANGLPPLNVRAEFEHDVSITQQREFRAYCEQHANERVLVDQQVLEEFCRENGPPSTHTAAQSWRLRVLGRQRSVRLHTGT